MRWKPWSKLDDRHVDPHSATCDKQGRRENEIGQWNYGKQRMQERKPLGGKIYGIRFFLSVFCCFIVFLICIRLVLTGFWIFSGFLDNVGSR